jgi:hypothetical protein
MNRLRIACRAVLLANEATQSKVDLFLSNQLSPREADKEHWVQLSPFGDFANRTAGAKVIQRLEPADAQTIANSFNGAGRRITQPLGTPWYIGHPDHPAFRGKPGHDDTKAYGRGQEMAVRADANCAACRAFANAKEDAEAAPCQQHGLFMRMKWNPDGEHLLTNESFHGHSVNWSAVPDGSQNGTPVYRPVRVKSVGFTNEPNIPVKPASLANAESDGDATPSINIVHPAYKELAGFKPEDDVTQEQCIAAIRKRVEVVTGEKSGANEVLDYSLDYILLVNAEKDDGDDAKAFIKGLHEKMGTDPKDGIAPLQAKLEEKLKDHEAMEKVRRTRGDMEKAGRKSMEARDEAEKRMANERQAAVSLLVSSRRIDVKDAPAVLAELANVAPDKFAEKLLSYGNSGAKVHSFNLANANFLIGAADTAKRRSHKWNELMTAREREFPNEKYNERYAAVAASADGSQLVAQMKKGGAEDEE